MKCRIYKCKAKCCYNIPFENNELEKYADKIVNPVLETSNHYGAQIAFTAYDVMKNKCPFLRADYKCNIYEHRPDICRKFGSIPELPCKLIKQ